MTKQTILLAAALLATHTIFAQRIESIDAQRIEVTSRLDNAIPDDVLTLIAPYKTGVDSLMAPVLGVSDITMAPQRPESTLNNWTADVLRQHSRKYGKMADIGLCNVGGLRSSIPQGNVTVGDILEVAPFQNAFVIITLPGTALQTLCEEIAHNLGEAVSGLQLNISADGKLLSAKVNGKAINPKKNYRIATIDFVADGNDGMTALKQATHRQTTGEMVRDVYMDYIRQQQAQGRHITAAVEGRVTVDGKDATQLAQEKAAEAASNPTLLIVHTNDTHSAVMPLNPNSANRQTANKAGYLRRAALIEQLRSEDPDLLLLDDGDFSQGSAYYNLYKGEVEVKLMNAMHYDAATIGNHEFDFGLENMRRIFTLANFPIVCCNYDFSQTPCRDVVKPYTIIERKGLRIGILGVSPKLEGLVAEATYGNTKYNNPVDCANEVAAKLKNEEHCDIVICLSHLGWNDALSDTMNDRVFVSHTRNIDIVIGGHSHTYFEKPIYVENLDGQPVPVNQMGKNGQWIGTLTVKTK